MLEMKITIAAPDLAAAINNLAVALDGKNTKPVAKANAPAASAPIARPATPTALVNPTTAPTESTQAPSVPLNATPAQTVAPVAHAPVVPAVPTGAPTYTLEMIARAGTALVDAGKMDALCNLLSKYQVEALTALEPAQYGNFANDLRALGAQI